MSGGPARPPSAPTSQSHTGRCGARWPQRSFLDSFAVSASALTSSSHAARLSRPGLLRLRSDEALVALFRAGDDAAFDQVVARYRDRLIAYARHVLRGSDEAEDVVQDVLVRAHAALRRDDRQMVLRPWLYRIAHNRCMDVLRRPAPVLGEPDLDEVAPADTAGEAERREDLRHLVGDIGGLPPQQRSALIIRELEGLSHEQMAEALDTTVPGVKSLLVRARMGLAEAAEARALPCSEARAELGVRTRLSPIVRRHLAGCADCRAARDANSPPRRRRAAAALVPFLATGPLRWVNHLLTGAPGAPDPVSAPLGGAVAAKAVIAAASFAAIGGTTVAVHHPHAAHRPAPAATAPAARPAAPARAAEPPARPAPQSVLASPATATAPAAVTDAASALDAAGPAGDGATVAPDQAPPGVETTAATVAAGADAATGSATGTPGPARTASADAPQASPGVAAIPTAGADASAPQQPPGPQTAARQPPG